MLERGRMLAMTNERFLAQFGANLPLVDQDQPRTDLFSRSSETSHNGSETPMLTYQI